MGRLKALFLILLIVSAAAVLSAGTLAAYNQTIEVMGTIRAARMEFNVNGSGTETQPLCNLALLPGEKKTFNIEIDTKGTEVGLDVELKVTASGDKLPPGLSVEVDGRSVDLYGLGGVSSNYRMDGDSVSRKEVPVVILWDATQEELMGLYGESQNFTLRLSATVTATQAAKAH